LAFVSECLVSLKTNLRWRSTLSSGCSKTCFLHGEDATNENEETVRCASLIFSIHEPFASFRLKRETFFCWQSNFWDFRYHPTLALIPARRHTRNGQRTNDRHSRWRHVRTESAALSHRYRGSSRWSPHTTDTGAGGSHSLTACRPTTCCRHEHRTDGRSQWIF
jgi:hypothetical protein